MKYLVSIFVIFTITIKPILPVVNYAVNYHYISENLCENRNKPQLSCNGKCFLAKELSKTQEESTQIISRANSIDHFIAQDIFMINNHPVFIPKNRLTNIYFDFYDSKYICSFFHPPVV